MGTGFRFSKTETGTNTRVVSPRNAPEDIVDHIDRTVSNPARTGTERPVRMEQMAGMEAPPPGSDADARTAPVGSLPSAGKTYPGMPRTHPAARSVLGPHSRGSRTSDPQLSQTGRVRISWCSCRRFSPRSPSARFPSVRARRSPPAWYTRDRRPAPRISA